MTIHFTDVGVFADTEEERLAFYDRICAGDPLVWGHIAIWEREYELANGEKDKPNVVGNAEL